MKTFLLLLLILQLAIQSFSQDTATQVYNRNYYLTRSSRQKTGAFLLLAGGAGMIIAGAATFKLNLNGPLIGDPAPYSNGRGGGNSNALSTGLFVAGFGAMLGSIPLFISAHDNKVKALSLSINNNPVLLPIRQSLVVSGQPTLTLRLTL